MYSPPTGDTGSFMRQMTGGRYAVPLPPPLAIEEARKSVIGELAILTRIERASKGEVAVCRTTAGVRSAIECGKLAVVLHLEGAEAIDGDLNFSRSCMRRACARWGRSGAATTSLGMASPSSFPPAPISATD